MKTQGTFKKKSGHTPVLCVRKYFLASALSKLTNMYLNGSERLAIVLSLQTKLVSAHQYFWHL